MNRIYLLAIASLYICGCCHIQNTEKYINDKHFQTIPKNAIELRFNSDLELRVGEKVYKINDVHSGN